MRNVYKIFFKEPLRSEPRGFLVEGLAPIPAETITNFDPENNCITVGRGVTLKSGGDNIWIMSSDRHRRLRVFVPKNKIAKIELKFE